MFKTVYNALKKVLGALFSSRAREAVKRAAELVELALPFVEELSTISPKTARLEEVAAAYRKYGIPVAGAYAEADATVIGNLLMNLATERLSRTLAISGAVVPATNILNSAVQLAVTLVKNR